VKSKKTLAVEKAYASRIILDHSRWAVDWANPDPKVVKKDRYCNGCGTVLTTGYDPTEIDMAGHQYDELLKAGMGWLVSPTEAPDANG
jgi:hypothetical protein